MSGDIDDEMAHNDDEIGGPEESPRCREYRMIGELLMGKTLMGTAASGGAGGDRRGCGPGLFGEGSKPAVTVTLRLDLEGVKSTQLLG